MKQETLYFICKVWATNINHQYKSDKETVIGRNPYVRTYSGGQNDWRYTRIQLCSFFSSKILALPKFCLGEGVSWDFF